MTIEQRLMNSLRNELSLSEDKIEIVTFGYRLFIYSILGYLCIALPAYFFGTLSSSLTAAITASLFRIFSGGAHASSQKRCVIIGAVIFNFIGFIVKVYQGTLTINILRQISLIVAIVALISFILYAPADTPGKPINTKVQRSRLKGISIILLVVWLIVFNLVVKGEINIHGQYLLATSLGLAWQGVTLWPLTYGLIIFK